MATYSVLNVVAVQNRNLPVNNHVLRMERPDRRTMIVLDFQGTSRKIIWGWELDFRAHVGLRIDRLMWGDDLVRVATVVH